jgi:chemotaxis signal transduction protein
MSVEESQMDSSVDPFILDLQESFAHQMVEQLDRLRPDLERSGFAAGTVQESAPAAIQELKADAEKVKFKLIASWLTSFERFVKEMENGCKEDSEIFEYIYELAESMALSLVNEPTAEKKITQKFAFPVEQVNQLRELKTRSRKKSKLQVVGGTSMSAAHANVAQAGTGAEDLYMIFQVMNLQIAVPVTYVQEIVTDRRILTLPDGRKDLLGLLNLRGDPIPIFDLGQIWSRQGEIVGLFLICNFHGKIFGLKVNRADQVRKLDGKDFLPVDNLMKDDHLKLAKAIAVIDSEQTLIIDLQRLVA